MTYPLVAAALASRL